MVTAKRKKLQLNKRAVAKLNAADIEQQNNVPVEYVIYVRKSTEDTSWERQAQSIPDQIEACVKYAERNNLILKRKPAKFEFETEEDLKIEDNDKDFKNRKIYQETRHLYIIKERMSGSNLGRPRWNLLVDKIRKGEIRWLISYSPDRQARNMVDGGNIIDCVDNWLVDLKYTNFNFEPNATGKMMLGIYFVFSKNYSDKLWEDVDRWKKSAVEKWNSQGEFKYGYYRDENKHFVPDGENFNLMKEAFRLKVEEKASDKYIAKRLNDNGFFKRKGKKKESVNPGTLSSVWQDSFYCWLYSSWKNMQDLREVEWLNFIPLISEDWHNILVDRNLSKRKKVEVKASTRKDEYAFSLPEAMLKLKGTDYSLSPYITKKIHRLAMYEEALKENPALKLEDFIQSSRVRYEIKTNSVKDKKISKTKTGATIAVNQDDVENKIANVLSKLKISDKEYKSYLEFINTRMEALKKERKDKESSIKMRMGNLEKERKEYVKKHMWVDFKNAEEKAIYEETMQTFCHRERILRGQLNAMFVTERNVALEFEAVVKVLENAANTYKNSSNVRKKKLVKKLFSNIYVDNKKGLTIEVNPSLKNILAIKWSGPGRSLEEPNNIWDIIIEKVDFSFIKKMVQFYISDIEPFFDVEKMFSKTQQVLYGVGSS